MCVSVLNCVVWVSFNAYNLKGIVKKTPVYFCDWDMLQPHSAKTVILAASLTCILVFLLSVWQVFCYQGGRVEITNTIKKATLTPTQDCFVVPLFIACSTGAVLDTCSILWMHWFCSDSLFHLQ
jgi:hypothetical protein